MSSDTQIVFAVSIGVVASSAAVYYTHRQLKKISVNSDGPLLVDSIVFVAVFLFAIWIFAPPKDEYNWDDYHKLKADEDYFGQKMLETSQNGKTGQAEDWADKYSAAKQKADEYYEHLDQFEKYKESTNSVPETISESTNN